MKFQRFFRWLSLILAAIILISPLLYWSTGVGQVAPGLRAEIIRLPDGSLLSSPKAEALHSVLLPMQLQRLLIYPLLLLAFQFSGGAVGLRQWLEQRLTRPPASLPPVVTNQPPGLTRREILVILLFFLIFETGLALLYLPFNFYRGFILMQQFGLSTQSEFGWVGDWLKSLLIGLFTGGLVWTGLYLLMRRFPRRWPVPAGAALLVLGFVFTLLAPILITPLFFKVQPLGDADLTSRILNLTERAGLKVDRVEVIDASAKTTTVNAYFTGFGDDRRIVLYDTLLSGYTPDQIEVVLAHEMGHWYYHHVFWSVLGLGVAGWLGLFGLRWLLNRTWPQLGLRGPADIAGLPFVLAAVAIATMLSLPFQNAISRYAERQADWFALATSQKPAAFIELFEQFAEQNLSVVDASAWEKFIFYTHPATLERIRMAERWQANIEGEQK
jgi:STE24 endopeptidase